MADEVERPNLEEIANKLANIEENHKIDQIMPSVMKAFTQNTAYKDENGVEHYRTKFTEDQAENLADALYDTLLHHSLQRQHGVHDDAKYKDLLDIKDSHGNSIADSYVRQTFGLTRNGLRNSLKDSRNNINYNTVAKIMGKSLETHTEYHIGEVLSNLRDEHAGHVKDFINHNVNEKGLDKKQYDLTGKNTIRELSNQFYSIAAGHYKHWEPKKDK